MSTLLECEDLAIARGQRLLLRDLHWRIGPGECWAILGTNGAGKTTLLHVLAGLMQPQAGAIRIADRPLSAWRRRALARTVGLMPQDSADPFPATVLETALMGRHPHLGLWQAEGAADLELARMALAAVDLAGAEPRPVSTLSGGERRRLALATLLVQQPRIMLLDEPTNHLDLRHQIRLLEKVRESTATGGAAVMVMHDLNLTHRFCSHALLLFGDGRWAAGRLGELMNEERLSELYDYPIRSGTAFLPG